MENPKITPEEIALIKDAQAGDIRAFNKLFKRYKQFVYIVLNQFINDEDESKDLVNIVFLKVYNKLSTFKAYDSFGGWLRVISNRTAIDYLRKTQNQISAIGEDGIRLIPDSPTKSLETDLVNQDFYDKLLSEIEKLPESARKVFKLFYIRDLSVEQIAERLKMPKGTVKSHLSRTRKRLKKQISKQKLS